MGEDGGACASKIMDNGIITKK